MQRVRVTFAKSSEIRFTSHLDLSAMWHRMLRRARIPIALSEGFARHPRMTFAAPLSTGHIGEAEIVDLVLKERLALAEILQRLREASPPGINVYLIQHVALESPALPASVTSAHYRCDIGAHSRSALAHVRRRLREALASETLSVIVERKGESLEVDVRPWILNLFVSRDETAIWLEMHLRHQGNVVGRPDDVLEALGLADTAGSIHRAAIQVVRQSGN